MNYRVVLILNVLSTFRQRTGWISVLFQKRKQLLPQPIAFMRLTLPNDHDLPTCSLEVAHILSITKPVLLEFGFPEVDPSCRSRRLSAAVPMPKAAVYEDNFFETGKHKVWAARKAGNMKSVSITEGVNEPAYDHFRLRMPLAHGRHHPAADLLGDDIHWPL